MKVLVVIDNPQTVSTLELCFKVPWPESQVMACSRGADATEMIEGESPDVVILDLDLPDKDGLDVLRDVRRFSDVPVIILTARNNEMGAVSSLDAGADDYITKPFSHLDFLARVKAVLRRSQGSWPEEKNLRVESEDLVIDFDARQVLVRGQSVDLTPTEYALLRYLVRNANRIVQHKSILRDVWGDRYDKNILKTYVLQLRRKLGDRGNGSSRRIVSVRGVGYKFIKSA